MILSFSLIDFLDFDLGILDETGKSRVKFLPSPPKILIEITSQSNYTSPGDEEFRFKLEESLKHGTEVAWVVHTGVIPHLKGPIFRTIYCYSFIIMYFHF